MTDSTLLVASHGFVGERERPHPAQKHVSRLQGTDAFEDVYAGLVHGEPAIERSVRRVETDRLVVVPLFVSGGYFVGTVIPDAVEAACPADVRVEYTNPLGTHGRLTDIIMRRALAAVDSDDVGVSLYGHGSEQTQQNKETVQEHARRLRSRGPFAEVRSYFVEEEPTGEELTAAFDTSQVIIVPVFVADGGHVSDDIPEQVGFTGSRDTVDSTEIAYVPPVGTDPLVADIIFERATATVTESSVEPTPETTTQKRRQNQ